MALSEDEKKRIREEEEYRSQVRNEVQPTKKKKGYSLKHAIIGFFVICLFIGFIGVLFDSTSTKSTTNSPQEVKDTSDLVGDVTVKDGHIDVTNAEAKDWKGCYFTLNSDYKAPYNPESQRYTIPSGETSSFLFSDFVNDKGEIFNPYKYKLMKIAASCEQRFGFWQWQ